MSEKTPKRKQWNKESMVLAVKAVRNHEMGYKTASKQFGVPKGTIMRYVKNVTFSPEELVDVNLGRKPVLGKAIETELVKYCLDMDDRFYGLRRSDVLIRRERKKKLQQREKPGARKLKFSGVKAKKRNRKRVESSSSGSSDIEDVSLADNSEDEDDNDGKCLFCTGLYSADRDGEEWIQCKKCYLCAHEHCGVEDAIFICPPCKKNK